jgi:hypothetical protein
LTENIEAKRDAKLKKDFKSSYRKANAGFIAWCGLALILVLCLALWALTGVPLFTYIGLFSVSLAFPAISLAFLAQTWNQIVRVIAKKKGKSRDFFKEEEKACSLPQTVRECRGFVKSVFNRNRDKAKLDHDRNEVNSSRTRNRHVRNNARSYHNASRPAFAQLSGDSGGGNDDSGDSDSSGDNPPEPSYHTPQPTLSQYFVQKLNSFLPLWRSIDASDCCCLPCRQSSVKGARP